MTKVLLTGATGFVGSSLANILVEKSMGVKALVRRFDTKLASGIKQVSVGDFNQLRNIYIRADIGNSDSLSIKNQIHCTMEGIDVVIHTAARVHIMKDKSVDPLTEFRKLNRDVTLALAQISVEAGVERFVFLSSIKVNGESTIPGKPFTADDQPNPTDPYGLSKWETEVGLQQLAKDTGMEVVIIRPPLVYGPGVKANFRSMMRWVSLGVPLPLGAINNQRSLVALDNLVDLIVTCIEHPAAANQTFMAGDGEALSTTELLQRIGRALGKPAQLIPVPASLLIFIASLLGKKAVARRLCGSLQVDISKTRELLGWEPPVSVDEGLRRTAEEFKN
ncbi:MAG: SDR family oxidoreductase [Gammaproteobacteria bacterium]|nr:SDR family oxidoreductase [Gammaproteobacteria bacterium]